MYDEQIELASVKDGDLDEYEDPEECFEKKKVFAQRLSIGQKEFYQAQTAGMQPEIKFVIADYADYNRQPYLIYEGIRYKILKTYRKGNELELTCYGGVRDAVAAVSD